MIRRDQLARRKTFMGNGKAIPTAKWRVIEGKRARQEEGNKLSEVAWDRPLPLYLLHGRAGLQTSTASKIIFFYLEFHLWSPHLPEPKTAFTLTT